jgi:hypothetical protein
MFHEKATESSADLLQKEKKHHGANKCRSGMRRILLLAYGCCVPCGG